MVEKNMRLGSEVLSALWELLAHGFLRPCSTTSTKHHKMERATATSPLWFEAVASGCVCFQLLPRTHCPDHAQQEQTLIPTSASNKRRASTLASALQDSHIIIPTSSQTSLSTTTPFYNFHNFTLPLYPSRFWHSPPSFLTALR